MNIAARLFKSLRRNVRGSSSLAHVQKKRRRLLLIENLERREVFAAPTLAASSPLSPADDATVVSVGTNMSATFNQDIVKGTGNILVKRSADNSTMFSIDVTSSRVSVTGATLTINPPGDLRTDTSYYMQIPNTAVKNSANEFFAGINTNTAWNFRTENFSGFEPAVSSFSPLDNATNVSLYADLVLTFNVNVVRNTGNITIKRSDNDTTVHTIDVNSNLVSLVDNVITINPSTDLSPSVGYYVSIPNDTIVEPSGLPYPGIDNKTTWNFSTKALPTLNITSGDRDYNGDVYSATASITGFNAPQPTLSYTYYSDAAGSVELTEVPKNAGTYYVRAFTAENAGNAAAMSPIRQFQINRKALSVTAPTINSKSYDGTTTAGPVSVGTLSGFAKTETVTATATAANFSSANVGTYSNVTVTYTLADGTNGGLASNYSLANGTGTGVINRRALTISAPSIAAREYDGTSTAGAVTAGTLSGLVSPETLIVSGLADNYVNTIAGTYNNVVVTYTLVNGTNNGLASNYSLANGAASGVINPKALTITAPSIASKVYDRTTTAGSVTVGSLSGLVGNETLIVSGTAAAYLSANVGSYSTTITYTLLNGNNSGKAVNYSLASGTATGSITAKSLTITGLTGNNKTYDGNTTATVSGTASLSGVINGDTISLQGTPSFAFDNKNVGTSKTITASGYIISGTGFGNYTLNQPTGLSGDITAKSLTITAPTIASRAYDGTTSAGSVTVGTLSGFIDSETVTATGTAAAYSSKNVGTYPGVTVTYTLVDGSNGGLATNYSLASGTADGEITARLLNVTSSATNKVYDGNASATVTIDFTNIVGTENVTGSATGTFNDKNVGTNKTVTVGTVTLGGTDAGNYTVGSAPSTSANITRKALTITAEAKAKVGGRSDPALTFTSSGLVDGDSVSGSLARAAGETAGVYAINQGTVTNATNPNYDINFSSANLTVTFTLGVNTSGAGFSNAAQRSMITSLVVNFYEPVTLNAGAFTLRNLGVFTDSVSSIPPNQLVISPASGSSTSFTITFLAGSGANGTTLNGVTKRQGGASTGANGNTLADGNYELTINTGSVTGGTALTGNNVIGNRATDNFFRIYGDSNGDGLVNGTDFAALRAALAGGSYNAAFDFDGGGTVSSATGSLDVSEYTKRQNRRRRVGY